MNRRTITLGALALSVALAIPAMTQAGSPEDCPKGGFGGLFHGEGKHGPFSPDRLPPYLEGLNLSDAQRATIAEILKTRGAALYEKAQEGRKAHEELRKLSFSSEYTEEKAKALVNTGTANMAEVALLHAGMDHAIFQALTPEQQQQVKEKAANFQGRFRRH